MQVAIAEDLALLRDGLTRLLRDSGCEVVAAVENGDDLVAAVEETVSSTSACPRRSPTRACAALRARQADPAPPC